MCQQIRYEGEEGRTAAAPDEDGFAVLGALVDGEGVLRVERQHGCEGRERDGGGCRGRCALRHGEADALVGEGVLAVSAEVFFLAC